VFILERGKGEAMDVFIIISGLASIIAIPLGIIAIIVSKHFYDIGKKEHEDFLNTLGKISASSGSIIEILQIVFAQARGISPDEAKKEIASYFEMKEKMEKEKYIESLTPIQKANLELIERFQTYMKSLAISVSEAAQSMQKVLESSFTLENKNEDGEK
jgi:hypothetical protein